jgi:hypothetical protein
MDVCYSASCHCVFVWSCCGSCVPLCVCLFACGPCLRVGRGFVVRLTISVMGASCHDRNAEHSSFFHVLVVSVRLRLLVTQFDPRTWPLRTRHRSGSYPHLMSPPWPSLVGGKLGDDNRETTEPTRLGEAHGHESPCHDHRALPLLLAC